jgi:hypothetical protein
MTQFAEGQPALKSRIGYFSQFPFIVETDLYLPHSISYNQNNTVDIYLKVLSPHLRIGLLSDTSTYTSFHSLNHPQSEKAETYREIYYTIHGDTTATNDPYRRKVNDSFSDYILDTILKANQQVRIGFYNLRGQPFKQFISNG